MWKILFAVEALQGAAETPATETATGPGGMQPFVLIAIFFAVFYFLFIRPNSKREKERQSMLGSLSKGDGVITTGGIHGKVIGLTDKTVVLKVSDDPALKMEFSRTSVAAVVAEEESDES